MYSVHCTLTVLGTLYRVQYTMYSISGTVYQVYTVYSVPSLTYLHINSHNSAFSKDPLNNNLLNYLFFDKY